VSKVKPQQQAISVQLRLRFTQLYNILIYFRRKKDNETKTKNNNLIKKDFAVPNDITLFILTTLNFVNYE
jgi:hypothetical protein